MGDNLLCLSSNLAPRYRLDSLRALALPRFALLQFRYSEDIIAEELQQRLNSDRLTGAIALLGQVDCSSERQRTDGSATVTPLRRAVLRRSRKVGAYYILEFRLWGYAVCSGIEQYQLSVPPDRPRFKVDKLAGLWCMPVAQHQGWEEGFGLDSFQATAKNLAAVPDFSGQPFFYAVEGLHRRNGAEIEADQNGEFSVPASSQFEVRVFHFHPDHDHQQMNAARGAISVAPTAPLLEAVTTAILPIDSPYDLKTVIVKTANVLGSKTPGSLVVRVLKAAVGTAEGDELQPELVLPIRVQMDWQRPTGEIVALALLIWFQQFISASAATELSIGRMAALAVLALITAVVAVLSIKKPY